MFKIHCLLLLVLLYGTGSVSAQQVNKKALEKANWYTAPREFQIIDDRPVVKDFREAPQQSQTVDLGAGGAGGGGTIPAGGLHFGQPGVRNESAGLPKSSFGSNIPAHGIAPAAALPGAGLKSYAGQMKSPTALPVAGNRSYVPHRGVSSTRATAPAAVTHAAAPITKSYGSGYSTAPATTHYATTSEQLKVRGKLLHGQ